MYDLKKTNINQQSNKNTDLIVFSSNEAVSYCRICALFEFDTAKSNHNNITWTADQPCTLESMRSSDDKDRCINKLIQYNESQDSRVTTANQPDIIEKRIRFLDRASADHWTLE